MRSSAVIGTKTLPLDFVGRESYVLGVCCGNEPNKIHVIFHTCACFVSMPPEFYVTFFYRKYI